MYAISFLKEGLFGTELERDFDKSLALSDKVSLAFPCPCLADTLDEWLGDVGFEEFRPN